jgi:hypothetical protein
LCGKLPTQKPPLQIWATWLFYAVLIDLGDAIADELTLPVDRISLEMIGRGLYHFSVAHQKGLTDDPIKYFAAFLESRFRNS